MKTQGGSLALALAGLVLAVLIVLGVFAYSSIYTHPGAASSQSSVSSKVTSVFQNSTTMGGTGSTNVSPSTTASGMSTVGGLTYLNESAVYASQGYPTLTYSSYSTYLPSKPNFTLEYQITGTSFQVGTVGSDVMSLHQAVSIGAAKAGLSPSNYSLAEADFEPGVVVNSALSIHPQWILFFAQVYQGYWLWGDVGNSAVSVQVEVDALSGNAEVSNGYFANGASNPPSIGPTPSPSGKLVLDVSSSQALAAIRGSDLQGVPRPSVTET